MPAKKTRKRRTPPSSSTSRSTNGAQPADSAAAAELELSRDDARLEPLIAFLESPPRLADSVRVCAWRGHDVPLIPCQARAREDIEDVGELAAAIVVMCSHWDPQRRVRFEIQWTRGERVLASLTQEYGSERSSGVELDGSVRSFLAQQQANSQAQHKLHLEGFEMVQEGWRSLLSLQNKRIEALERDNAELRDKLRKADDVGNEIAIENARADIEARGRTADILEKRLLPIAEAIAVQKIRELGAAKLQQAQQASELGGVAAPPAAGLRGVDKQ